MMVKKGMGGGKNSKGFSLIELIIVIAILAILVGVLVPNLLRYFEKANVAADLQLVDSIKTVFVAMSIDPGLGEIVSEFETSEFRFVLVEQTSAMVGNEFMYDNDDPQRYYYDRVDDTTRGAAIAEALGYPDFWSLIDPYNGIIKEFRQKRDQIVIQFYPSVVGAWTMEFIVIKDGETTLTYI